MGDSGHPVGAFRARFSAQAQLVRSLLCLEAMTRFQAVVFGTLSCIAGCAADDVQPDDDESEAAIVGDLKADGEHPEVVFLKFPHANGYSSCTGTLIGGRTVLTALHCLH